MTVYMARAILEYPPVLGARFYGVELWNLHKRMAEVLLSEDLGSRSFDKEIDLYEEAHIENYARAVKDFLGIDILKDLAYLSGSTPKESPDE